MIATPILLVRLFDWLKSRAPERRPQLTAHDGGAQGTPPPPPPAGTSSPASGYTPPPRYLPPS